MGGYSQLADDAVQTLHMNNMDQYDVTNYMLMLPP